MRFKKAPIFTTEPILPFSLNPVRCCSSFSLQGSSPSCKKCRKDF